MLTSLTLETRAKLAKQHLLMVTNLLPEFMPMPGAGLHCTEFSVNIHEETVDGRVNSCNRAAQKLGILSPKGLYPDGN